MTPVIALEWNRPLDEVTEKVRGEPFCRRGVAASGVSMVTPWSELLGVAGHMPVPIRAMG